jgi:glycosyltransferase involved in cell wall biosynthesis
VRRLLPVSIIVPTYNRADSLALTLPSLVAQSFPRADCELVVVDNASTDATSTVVHSLIREHPHHRIRYVYEPVPGLLSGRHRGAKEADGQVLVFVDDDIDADPGWLQVIVDSFADPSVQLVGGRNLPRYATAPPSWVEGFWTTTPHGGRACGYLSLLDLGEDALDIDADYIWGLNFSIRTDALFELGGFHPDSLPDQLQHFQGDGETGLTLKATAAGYRAVYRPGALVYHRVPASRLTLGYFRRRAFFQGICDSFTAIRRSRRVGDCDPEPKRDIPSGGPGRGLSRTAHGLVRTARRIVRHPRTSLGRLGHELTAFKVKRIHASVQQAYRAGYDFHQHAVEQSDVLLAWVLKKDYWDYTLPGKR